MSFADIEGLPGVAGWLGTFFLHVGLWIGGAACLAPRVRAAGWRARLWRGAALGGLLSTAVALGLGTSRLALRWERVQGPLAEERVSSLDGVTPATLAVEGVEASPGAAGSGLAGAHPGASGISLARWSGGWESGLVALWLVGALVGLLRFAHQHRALGRALRARRPLRGPLVTELERLAREVGFTRPVRLSITSALDSPVALARNEIVLPERALERLTRAEQETLVAHELAHLVARDPHWLLALGFLERLFWFQPLLRLARRGAVAASELRCDEEAARWTGQGLALARCLAEVASWVTAHREVELVSGMAPRPSALVERVERLLAPVARARFQGVLVGSWSLATLAFLGCSGPTVGGKAAAHPEPITATLAPRPESPGSEALGLEWVGATRIQAWSAPGQERDERLNTALEALSQCPEAGIAFHVDVRDGAYDGRSILAPESHTLRLGADGSIRCGAMPLLLPWSEDERLLLFHLAEIARCMPKAPAGSPEALPDGTLEVRIETRTPHEQLLRVLELCGRGDVRLWKFSLVLETDGVAGTPLPYALPRDLPGEPPRAPTEVRVRGRELDGERLRSVGYELRGGVGPSAEPGAFEPVATLDALAARLEALRSSPDERALVLDGLPGTRYAEILAVIDVVVAAGYTDIRFVGRRHR